MRARYERSVGIAVYGSRWEVELKRGALESAGIPTRVTSDDAGGIHPPVAHGGAYQLHVAESDVPDARTLLGELDALDAAPRPERPAGWDGSSRSLPLWIVGLAALLVIVAFFGVVEILRG